mmetsp:Transcript_18789/g.54332  ORF Transcript_18789/g.54332 Transcript_18789/m.54332 type:complete len:123 (-) Transcript_18789:197-565(-)
MRMNLFSSSSKGYYLISNNIFQQTNYGPAPKLNRSKPYFPKATRKMPKPIRTSYLQLDWNSVVTGTKINASYTGFPMTTVFCGLRGCLGFQMIILKVHPAMYHCPRGLIRQQQSPYFDALTS